MPLYEYYCEKCGKAHEEFRPVAGRDDPAPCPTCRAVMTRGIGSAEFIWAPWFRKENDESRARHREWLAKPETQKRIKEDRLQYSPGNYAD